MESLRVTYLGVLLDWHDDLGDSPHRLLIVNIHVLSVAPGGSSSTLDSADLCNVVTFRFSRHTQRNVSIFSIILTLYTF